ncbi:MJ0307 family thioredoxin [Methanocaldococcus infernus]|uniref:Redox-active disulfide protein 1 n=1 Tax=Methanocaldococcus infernus (strain DSM 11812 / JCM 15783 / ME) TaxID=573063 RepID=D5VTG8_METIM|nr:MJ0307 family thioredoxin [Methanocaldococcus infernus]ADG13871.1 redox-active disulfide protein 1 [Methanocaldococcus infernus ME]
MVKVEVFTSPMCPHCPAAKRVVEEVAKEMPIEVEYIDVTQNPQKAMEYGIMAVPTIVIDGEIEFIGAPTKEALIEAIKKRL